MSLMQKAIDHCNLRADSKSIYVLGAQGQQRNQITEAWIKMREHNKESNYNRAIKKWKWRLALDNTNFWAYDCSGLLVDFLLSEGLIPQDYNANGLKQFCKFIPKEQARKGCFVFRVDDDDKDGNDPQDKAFHVGMIVDEQLNVVHAKGRDYGVVKEHIDANGSGYWELFGIPIWWENEIENNTSSSNVLTRQLKRTIPNMKGEDVKKVQQALINKGFDPKGVDGAYGSNTEKAIIAFQKAYGLKVDGIVGNETYSALMSDKVIVSPAKPTVPPFTISRQLKKKTPTMKGEDVKAIQNALNILNNAGLKVDGSYGSLTEAAVIAFQKKNGLKVDGIVGRETTKFLQGTYK